MTWLWIKVWFFGILMFLLLAALSGLFFHSVIPGVVGFVTFIVWAVHHAKKNAQVAAEQRQNEL